ncbi:MAG: glycosyltransferase family 2 protein [Paracoccaceae bacterium]
MTIENKSGAAEARSICVVVPAYNAAHLLPRVLQPLMAMLEAGEVQEVIVVDDCSPDNTAEVARELGARVIVTPANGGPGVARNLAAEQTNKSILWLVDSDVIAALGGPEKIRAAFSEPDVKAVFGSYDETPDGTPWFSRYKNLTHRYYHQIAQREATTFWAGCGALDAEFFRKVGGFDVETYRVPSIEDIELGYRIRQAGGRIILAPDLLGKHLKVWSPRNAIFTDIFRRALPWSRLMISKGPILNDLNTSKAERLKAAVAGLFVGGLFSLIFVPSIWPAVLALMLLVLWLNRDFAAFLVRHGGWVFAAGSLLYHQFYYIYSASAFVWCLFEYHILGKKDRLQVP